MLLLPLEYSLVQTTQEHTLLSVPPLDSGCTQSRSETLYIRLIEISRYRLTHRHQYYHYYYHAHRQGNTLILTEMLLSEHDNILRQIKNHKELVIFVSML